ncbi:neutral and basic amino acid transport protein rBAT [Biomphalaria pfeifferi]|uniref:Neutral and basic amino acid transport protein rBAT n=1 Tax=Biomphalaria pfeifferi TaxID=112525 RepID=A0AAD8BA56_BIOPF|nr:neutral and basic amino acid transport protein rBAT [Biomphalaria pfeifferi]
MDANGISLIGAKSIHSDGHAYVNAAFRADDGKRNIQENTSQASPHSSPTVSIKIASNEKLGSENAYNEITPQKRDSGSVEFNVPKKAPSKEKLKSDGPYRGMGKEELLRHSSRPLWRNLRYVCISVVLTGWLALLITVIALVLTYPKCREAQERDWWQKTVIYRVYVRSFYDSENDGNGDINGLRQQLDYLSELGVNTLALSPIFRLAPNATSDTQIVNHTDIDPMFGTLEQFKQLVNETHSRGMHIILDFIPNHTSDEHPWFIESKKEKDTTVNVYRSYYVWSEGRGTNGLIEPNNWTSVFQCSAWKKSDINFFYLHQFELHEPELNLRSEKVRVELENILQFWLDLGVDGFYIRDADYLFEDYDLRDDILLDNTTEKEACIPPVYKYEVYDHIHTKGLDELFDVLARWRSFLDDYGNKTKNYRLLLADVDGSYNHVMNYYGRFHRDGVDFPLNKFSLDLNSTSDGQSIGTMVIDWLENMPAKRWANWMSGDDRSVRLLDRLGHQLAGPYLMLSMLLPGTPYMYYGDEIGLQALPGNTSTMSRSAKKPMRGPMQWSNRTYAGFCKDYYCKEMWIEPNPEYLKEMNVEFQKGNPESILNLFKNLTSLRKDKPSFEYGDFIQVLHDNEVFSFVREFDGEKGYLVALNFADKEARKTLKGRHSTIPGSASVEVAWGEKKLHSKGGSAGLDPVTLAPYEGIVVSWDYKAKEL